jgi:hypothetical protein
VDGQEDGEGAGQDRDPEPTPPASGSPVPGPAPAGPDPRLAGFAYVDSGDAPAPSGPMALLTAIEQGRDPHPFPDQPLKPEVKSTNPSSRTISNGPCPPRLRPALP